MYMYIIYERKKVERLCVEGLLCNAASTYFLAHLSAATLSSLRVSAISFFFIVLQNRTGEGYYLCNFHEEE